MLHRVRSLLVLSLALPATAAIEPSLGREMGSQCGGQPLCLQQLVVRHDA